ncbi:MAG: iron ABC transporter permease [Deltaproteobacteria bacterium]|nr:iron ABC transporter permease [Deltaproteobacteria bacterium]
MKIAFVYAALVALLLATAGLALGVGHGSLSDPALRPALLELRATRVLAALLAGASLAAAGVVVQGVFRNPLVSPSILGTTAGASLGGQLALLALAWGAAPSVGRAVSPELVLPLGCLVGASVSLGILLAFCRERTGTLVLILTGFILSSLFLAIGGFVTSLAQDQWDLSRAVVAFTLGGVGGTGPNLVAAAAPFVLVGLCACWAWSGSLDVLLSGEDEARTLGVEVGQVRRWTVVWVAVLTSAAIALGGNVGFVGLVVPHALRPVVGVGHRRLIPAAALLGAAFLVGCDVIARVFPSRAELPLGVITGILGAPVFLYLLARYYREVEHG